MRQRRYMKLIDVEKDEARKGEIMLTEKENEVLNSIDENKGEIIEYLRKLVSFKTTTPKEGAKAEGDDYKDLQNFICNTL